MYTLENEHEDSDSAGLGEESESIQAQAPGLPSGWSKDHTLGKQGLEFRAEILTPASTGNMKRRFVLNALQNPILFLPS